ncbi:MAG: hypothetical protein COU35_05280 [Candidatus Magasanikbacteria bacterium CG10_big_fil_rev_8_21_14_0_10_47_10]|uniref:Uncharacterized protein n=1 Tax=Candidatus Magasanikbacteria bacterium CG10_big_fil_rev_8_21_14_0_10_47_10 TaxID=1974652 RepID=A0A2H0TP36_9BACT|nr:MAG: hypothetical protein COU35_05280 [Candidatus Magasanikbacteria bacterium CG10_big_fil_rev_8_21_14_0_10_47_10]
MTESFFGRTLATVSTIVLLVLPLSANAFSFSIPSPNILAPNDRVNCNIEGTNKIVGNDNIIDFKVHYTTAGVLRDLRLFIEVVNTANSQVLTTSEGTIDLDYEDAYVIFPKTGTDTMSISIPKTYPSVRVYTSLGTKDCLGKTFTVSKIQGTNVLLGNTIKPQTTLQIDGLTSPTVGQQAAQEPGVDDGVADRPADPPADQPQDANAPRQLPAGSAAQFGSGSGGSEAQLERINEAAAASSGVCEVIAEAAQSDDAYTMVAAVVYEGFDAGQTPFRVSATAQGVEFDSTSGIADIQGPDIGYLLNQNGEGFTFAIEREDNARLYQVSAKVGDVECSDVTFADAGKISNGEQADEQVTRVLPQSADSESDALAQALGLNAKNQVGKTKVLSGESMESIELKDIILYGLLATIAVVLVVLLVIKIKSKKV